MSEKSRPADPDTLMDTASFALFWLVRVFGKRPLEHLLVAPAGPDVQLSSIWVVQAVQVAGGDAGSATVSAVAEHLNVDPSTASRLVTQTLKAGYVHRVASQHDGRAVLLELTDAGHELARAADAYQRAVFDEVTRTWPESERTQFARLFVQFARGVVETRQPQVLPREHRK